LYGEGVPALETGVFRDERYYFMYSLDAIYCVYHSESKHINGPSSHNHRSASSHTHGIAIATFAFVLKISMLASAIYLPLRM
jgi:hypothetical protein